LIGSLFIAVLVLAPPIEQVTLNIAPGSIASFSACTVPCILAVDLRLKVPFTIRLLAIIVPSTSALAQITSPRMIPSLPTTRRPVVVIFPSISPSIRKRFSAVGCGNARRAFSDFVF